mmetsp:Transcript_18611/g.29553  ORF Transcript_18611/g.29553 Transcript_18611/m.29553 type:complete len:299 (+) Transcript_18611:94-990(+)
MNIVFLVEIPELQLILCTIHIFLSLNRFLFDLLLGAIKFETFRSIATVAKHLLLATVHFLKILRLQLQQFLRNIMRRFVVVIRRVLHRFHNMRHTFQFLAQIVAIDKSVRDATSVGPSGTPNPMNIILIVMWRSEIDHHFQIVDIETARGNRGTNQNRTHFILKIENGVIAIHLIDAAVQDEREIASIAQLTKQQIDVIARIDKNQQITATIPFAQQSQQCLELIPIILHNIHKLGDILAGRRNRIPNRHLHQVTIHCRRRRRFRRFGRRRFMMMICTLVHIEEILDRNLFNAFGERG